MLKEREEFYIDLIKSSNSLIEVCRKANIVPTTGNYDTLKKVIKENEVDISHFKRLGGVSNSGIKKDTSEYLINEVKRAGKRVLSDVKVFDLYKGINIGLNKKQIALKLTFQDMTRTLETSEVDGFIDSILEHLRTLGIKIRE